MIINIDPSYRVSVEQWSRRGGAPYSVWRLIESMSFRGSGMDGCSCVGSVVVTRPERLHNLASTSLSLSLFSIFFLLSWRISFTFQHYNVHACENACMYNFRGCMRECVQGRCWGDFWWNKLYFSPIRGYWFGGNKAVICWAVTLGGHDIHTPSSFFIDQED